MNIAWIYTLNSLISTLRVVFNLPVYLCLWHVRRCWLKHLVRKVKDWPTRAAMFRMLGNIMNMRGGSSSSYEITKDEAREMICKFKEDFQSEKEFLHYFEMQWQPKIGDYVLLDFLASMCCVLLWSYMLTSLHHVRHVGACDKDIATFQSRHEWCNRGVPRSFEVQILRIFKENGRASSGLASLQADHSLCTSLLVHTSCEGRGI